MTAAKKAAARPTAETKSAKKGPAYQVVAPLVAVKVGEQVLQYYAGDILPDGVAQDSIDHLSELGFIAEPDA